MGIVSSSPANSSSRVETAGPHILPPQNLAKPEPESEKMALAYDAQIPPHEDLGQDTLMGLQELDSQMTIFEESKKPDTDVTRSGQLSGGASNSSYTPSPLSLQSGNLDSPGKRASGSVPASGPENLRRAEKERSTRGSQTPTK